MQKYAYVGPLPLYTLCMQSSRGFSLIEILVSIGILGAIIGIYAISSNIVILSRHVRYDDVALRIASSKLETLRATPYASLPASGSFVDPLFSTFASSSGYVTVSDYNAETKRIDVVVLTEEAGNTVRSITLTTLVTEIGGL